MRGGTVTDTTQAPIHDFARQATQELILHGTELGDRGDAARHRARTWAILALAQATETQALETKEKP